VSDRPERLAPDDLARLRSILRSALVSDALDAVGLRRQTLGPDIHRMTGGGVLVGYALPVVAVPIEPASDMPYAGLRAALDRLRDDDVFVFATERSDVYAGWGELLSITARAAGAVGVVTDGLIRDVDQVERLGFPAYARGATPVDIAGRAEALASDEAVSIDGVRIELGDLVVADEDGIVVVPSAVRAEVIARALAHHADEQAFREAVGRGTTVNEALDRFNVL
jgi:4-hydroxy-4-methyl-2-oxoglutarate aldolase